MTVGQEIEAVKERRSPALEAQPACHRHSLTEGASFAFSDCRSRHHENRDPSFVSCSTLWSGSKVPPLPRQSVSDHRKYTPPDPLPIQLSSASRRTIDPIRGSKTASSWTWWSVYLFFPLLPSWGIPRHRFRLRHSLRHVFELWHWMSRKKGASFETWGSVRTSSTVGGIDGPVRFWRFCSLADSGPPSRAFTVCLWVDS